MSRYVNVLKRSTSMVIGQVEWPTDWKRWDDLSAETRNRVRDLLDEAIDLIAAEAVPY